MPKRTLKKSTKRLVPTFAADYEQYVIFSATPVQFRVKEYGYKSDTDFAKEHHISRDTITQWRERQDFWDARDKKMNSWGKNRTPDVIASLYRKAVDEGNAAEAKLWLQVFEKFSERSDTTVSLHRESLKAIQDGVRELVEQDKAK